MRTIKELRAAGFELQTVEEGGESVGYFVSVTPFYAYDRLEHRSMQEIVSNLRAAEQCDEGFRLRLTRMEANYRESAIHPLNLLDFKQRLDLVNAQMIEESSRRNLLEAETCFWAIVSHQAPAAALAA